MDQIRLDEIKKQIFPKTATDLQAVIKEVAERRDSEKFFHSFDKRQEIVNEYHEAKRRGAARNRDTWAQMHHGISGKTLSRYIKEFKQDTK